jgi:orotate phosphoribosyltransferase
VRQTLGLQVCAIAKLAQLLEFLQHSENLLVHYDAVAAYRERYGVE